MFIAPLRHAILHLAAVGRASFTIDAVALLGQASLPRARGYINRLAERGIVLRLPDNRVKRARNFNEWAISQPKTKPGGHRRISYRAVSQADLPC